LTPSAFGNKNPMLKIKNHSHPNKKPCAWNFFNPILRTKNHLHSNKKHLVPGIFFQSMLKIKNRLHPNKKPYAGVGKPVLRIKKPMLVVLGRGKIFTGTNGIAIWQNYDPFGIRYMSPWCLLAFGLVCQNRRGNYEKRNALPAPG